MFLRKFWPLVSFLALLVISGCGGGISSTTPTQPTPSVKPDFLYVQKIVSTSPNLNFEIDTFKMDPSTGALTPTSTTPLSQFSASFVADPTGQFLYVSAHQSAGDVINIFSIDAASGAPTQKGQFNPRTTTICSLGCPAPVNGPGPLTMDPAGKYLFYGSDTFGPTQVVGALAVDGTGNLTTIPGSPFPADNMSVRVSVHPTGRFVYTENIDPTIIFGNTAANSDPPSPNSLKSISGFSVASNGALVPIPGSPFIPQPSTSLTGLLFHPSGKFMYLPSGNSSTIEAWSIDPTTGALSDIPGLPVSPATSFAPGAIHPSGKFLYLPSVLGGIAGFSIDTNSGLLNQLSGVPFAADQRYICLAIDPAGRFLFVGDLAHSTIVTYKIDSTTGTLTASGTAIPVTGTPEAIAIVQAP